MWMMRARRGVPVPLAATARRVPSWRSVRRVWSRGTHLWWCVRLFPARVCSCWQRRGRELQRRPHIWHAVVRCLLVWVSSRAWVVVARVGHTRARHGRARRPGAAVVPAESPPRTVGRRRLTPLHPAGSTYGLPIVTVVVRGRHSRNVALLPATRRTTMPGGQGRDGGLVRTPRGAHHRPIRAGRWA